MMSTVTHTSSQKPSETEAPCSQLEGEEHPAGRVECRCDILFRPESAAGKLYYQGDGK